MIHTGEVYINPLTIPKVFQQAEIAKFTPTEAMEYEQSVNAYRDIKNGMEAKYEEGFGIGQRNAIESVARKMLAANVPLSQIIQFTGLSEKQINDLKN